LATYVYRDEQGEPLYRVVRTEPKTFRMETLDADGEWYSARDCMTGVRRVLYRLPEVLEAVRAGLPVFVAEGEKDADLLAESGVCATTAAGGALKWGSVSDAADALAGAEVVVVADRDEAGWRHALQVYESLGSVASVQVVASMTGNDAADHLASGFRVDELVRVDLDAELAACEVSELQERDTFAMLSRTVIRCGEHYRLDDACVRLYAVVDEAMDRTLNGRNNVAALLGWRPGKVTEHAGHLEAAGLFDVIDRPSGKGHKATVYRIAFNPARRGAVGQKRSTARSNPSSLAARPGLELLRPSTGLSELSAVDRKRSTSPPAVGRQCPSAILSTLEVSTKDEYEAVALLLRHFPGAETSDRCA
jgi:5S rRNA maturation endonuclease (ribonuclease M5)